MGKQQRLTQGNWLEGLRELHHKIEVQAQTSGEGDSYVNIIPYVAADANTRTNLGLNNYSQSSFTHGTNPDSNVLVGLFDTEGNLAGSGSFVVRSKELLQLNDIIGKLGGNISTGWLLIYSDEPLTCWASVIINSTKDPSIELAIADQINKPAAFVESTGTRLMIQSSAKVGFFQSSLVVVNVGTADGNLSIKVFDQTGNLLTTKTAFVRSYGMFVDNDIRSGVGGFGQIEIEVTDPNTSDQLTPRLVANSLVRSTNGTAAFFPAFVLPQANTQSIAGEWDGSLSGGGTISAQVRMVLFQERDMLYGTLDVLSGVFPTVDRNFSISGEIIDNKYLINIQDAFDGDVSSTFFFLRMFGQISGTHLQGDTIYFDEKNRSSVGTFDLVRVGSIY